MTAHLHYVLKRPDHDPVLCHKLFVKMEEYERRLERLERRLFDADPFLNMDLIRHYRYRIAILRQVLEHGQADLHQILRGFKARDEYGPEDEQSFNLACIIIIDYVEHCGVHLENASLPDVDD